MFCKKKFETEIINTDKQNFNWFIAIKGTFSLEKLENRCSV